MDFKFGTDTGTDSEHQQNDALVQQVQYHQQNLIMNLDPNQMNQLNLQNQIVEVDSNISNEENVYSPVKPTSFYQNQAANYYSQFKNYDPAGSALSCMFWPTQIPGATGSMNSDVIASVASSNISNDLAGAFTAQQQSMLAADPTNMFGTVV